MKRWQVVTGGAAILALVAVITLVPHPRGADPYAGLRQSRDEAIPGTFGYRLTPPDDPVVSVDPEAAYDELMGARRKADVSLTLATVRNDQDAASWGPAWVYITRDLCYFSAKGDFVSPSRGGDTDGCTPDNLLVQIVDANTGEFVAAFDAYDPSRDWLPARSAPADQLTAITRFH